ncbi:type ISP restriction/modification enzyme [Umezakia ovalisporum]|uniref:site-specific DNA-methyltransferase (adenine-specific) n=1 Tax=Umezakia ovalisporum FSS-62 TaxID=2971776 RepID=A0AA43KFQ1_9CYAN|nr:type ISP restriction/modification enzyme [Umezakia ovalisporum]MDH6064827.1 N-6 DNA methylase [Umezakia ovalisporum FSS-62]MDH6067427.1 N-6 DNA methylase [Umezakia ovalisporum APH033B]MDH6102203.1 N-6 DNA methylase [Umezakia ovalisporum ANA283AFssAo]
MSRLLISQYHTELEKIIQFGGSRKETSIRGAFQNLLNEYCKPKDFLLIPELDYKLPNGKVVYPDGTVKDALRLDWGYWESKDQYDNLNQEIEIKLNKGYPNSNILFEDSQTAVLIQSGTETQRVPMKDADALDDIINNFINYVRPEVRDFRQAIETFKQDLPTILNSLRDLIDSQGETNISFQSARNKFWHICQESINPEISLLDIREMMIQHILTEDIFLNIFNESQFHRENNVARELQEVITTFFTGNIRRNTLGNIERYYAVIRRTAANIHNHQEKQKFLKALYENFYKAYNPKAADRLGIVYTPNEVVRFMIESVDFLVHQHFGKLLADKNVEILDPATGTGTFITELIDYLPPQSLEYKYKHEIHCNEVAILPYYIANLNIEYTYKQKMGVYEEFENICFVDTLDNTLFAGKQMDLFAMTVENTSRIKRQNDKTISVIIGNPPYNANQQNENDNNKNRDYPAIDKLIKESYVKYSTAQKTKAYDMYTRFIRWATDRLGNNGIICFITNSSFLDGRAFDGFRKSIQDDFSFAYFLDLGGNVRAISGRDGIFISEKHTIFGKSAMTGILICFLVKHSNFSGCKIFYSHPFHIHELRDNKITYLATSKFNQIPFEHITPDRKHNWINQTDNDFDTLLPLVDKDVKAGKGEKAMFKLYTNAIKSNRDDWVYDFDQNTLSQKVNFFIDFYNSELKRYKQTRDQENLNLDNFVDYTIKWSRDLKKKFLSYKSINFQQILINCCLYRPFIQKHFYYDFTLNDILTTNHCTLFGQNFEKSNVVIYFSGPPLSQPFQLIICQQPCDYHFLEQTQCLSLYRYDKEGNPIDNITDWGLEQIQTHYQNTTITKIDIFHYTYAALHNPAYRQKYQLNLKRDFPRLPLYDNFPQWVNWGQQLMDLHINYETVSPYKLSRVDIPLKDNQTTPKAKLKADKTKGSIIIDDITTLQNIPSLAWEYKLGNRCALEWILDQYKEKKPKDPTIAAHFHTYRFADYKQQVIDLLMRVCTISVETMNIIQQMSEKS